jgi:type IV pilus assembly protein PilZ
MTKTAVHNARRSPRLHHDVAVAYRSVGGFLSDWATNISRGGMFINTRHPLPVGTVVKLIIQLPGAAFPFDLVGRVARVVEWDNDVNLAPGMGIEFTHVDREKRDLIEDLVAKLRSQLDPG